MIRPATASDADAVTAIAQAAFTPYVARIGVLPIPMSLDYAAAIAAGRVWVAAEAEILGFVLLEDLPDSLLLDVLAVDPVAQKRGIGLALLTFVEQQARDRGYAQVTLYTHVAMTENLAYYPAHGYVETGRETVLDRQRVFFRKTVDD
jgi:predicted N-acetyltransferase YhbS